MTSETISSSAARGSARSIRNRSRVQPFARRERRRLAVADGVGAADDHAPRGLAEDVGELGDRDRPRPRPARRTACRRRPARAGRRRRRARRACAAPTARSSVTSSSRLAIEVSSTISRSASSSSTVGPWPGIQPSAEWTSRRRARSTRPSGARRGRSGRRAATDAFCASAAAQISRIVAVLPVPGPPVTIESREANAARDRRRLLGRGDEVAGGRRRRGFSDGVGAGERARRARASSASSAAVSGPVGPARRRRPTRARARPASAISLQQLRRPARRAEQLAARCARARRPAGTSSRRARPRSSTWTTAARARAGRVGGTPAARAIVSAIWKPTPNTLVRSYGRSRTTCVRAVAVLLRDPRDEPREPVRREQQVQRAGGAQRVPGLDRLVRRAAGSARRGGTRAAGSRSITSSTSSP